MTNVGRRDDDLPELDALYTRHPGLTIELCGSNAQAAAVCLARHHESPVTLNVSTWKDGEVRRYVVRWTPPDDRALRAWANPDNATEAGAYAVALASVEARYGLVGLARTGRHSGSDWWIGASTSDTELNFEGALRLEVAGMDRAADEAHILSRLSRKVNQVKKAGSGPARAVVVVFSSRRVAFRDA